MKIDHNSSRKLLLYCSLFIALLFFSCEKDTKQGQFERIVTLSMGENVYIQEKVFTIGFTKILEDSRCPTGAECVWEGNGKIEIFITQPGTATQYFELNTTLDPQIVDYFEYNIELIALDPYPSIEEVIDSMDYKCTLKIQGL